MTFKIIGRVSNGEIFFLGDDNKEIREYSIGKPITNKILNQICNFCIKLPDGEHYRLSWQIRKIEFIPQDIDR